ncbi:MAG: helix-turn-helix domain-containing protein [Candidatus Vogelbacteria bacterium]|nr:helix-turn-helix domain-containing protein [Candidatus Vogelbacteria bacterium]
MKTDVLEKIGLNKNEAKIYISLLEHGQSRVSTIYRNTKIHRPIIYKELPSLAEKGLVTEVVKGKQTYYSAESPDKLKSLVDTVLYQTEVLIPSLKEIVAIDKKPKVKFLEGKNAVKYVYNDILDTLPLGGIFYRYSSTKDSRKGRSFLPRDYEYRRNKQKIERYVITSEAGLQRKKPKMDRVVKAIPRRFGLFDYDVTQIIYQDKIAVIDDNTDTAIIIENPIIAEFQRKLFMVLFNLL